MSGLLRPVPLLGGAAAVGGIYWWYNKNKKPTEPIFVINGFYMAMREKYTKPPASIHYFLAEWDAKRVPWADFREQVLGGTDPTTAAKGSLRREVLEKWKELGLSSCPNVGDNSLHASASPFEAMFERYNWLQKPLDSDPYAQAMMKAGIDKKTIVNWTSDPQVPFEGKKGSLFDFLEDLSSEECIEKSMKIAGASGRAPSYDTNQAFIFVKPHAVNDKVVQLTRDGLAKQGIKVVAEGKLEAKEIEQKKLIDTHYGAIASKASLLKPKQLSPSDKAKAEFAKKWGLSWEDALKQGKVYNAVDGCSALGIGGSKMDDVWGKTKKKGELIKFGGGFYCGKIDPKEC